MINPPPINLGGRQARAALSVHAAGHRHRRAVSRGRRCSRTRCARLPGARGRQQRPAAEEPAGQRRARPRQDCRARPDRRPGRDRAVQRLRHAPGLADLRAEQPVPGDHAGRAGVPAAIRRRCRCSTCGRTAAG